MYFIREQIKRPAWLVNLYFLNDPIDPTSHDTWNAELQKVKSSLGLTSGVPYTIDLLLPALSSAEHQPDGSSGATDNALESDSGVEEEIALPAFHDSSSTEPIVADQSTLSVWVQRWLALGRYEGPSVPDVPQRIEQAVQHWRKPIPGLWKRGLDLQLLGNRYRRGDIDSPRNGEHAIEHAILCRHFDSVSCFGQKLLDGINAFPLVRDAAGARHDNVEADLFLLSGSNGTHHIFVCEVKNTADNAWYAALESLRQMRLLLLSPESLSVFTRRNRSLSLPVDVPVTSVVLAPHLFYLSPGKKANAVEPALRLLAQFRSEFNIDTRLATWSPNTFKIEELE